MADPSKRLPDWLDPLGISGSILDPFALFADAARMVVPPGESISWMMTMAARRLVGRRFRTHGDPMITATVAGVHEVVPAMTMSMPGVRRPIAVWDRVGVSLKSVGVDGKPVSSVDIVAEGVGVADVAAQSVLVADVHLTVRLTEDDLRAWLSDGALDAEVDMHTGLATARPWRRAGWIRVVARPEVGAANVSVRLTHLEIGRVRIPLPRWVPRVKGPESPDVGGVLDIKGVDFSDGQHAEVTLTGRDIELAVDIPRLVADVGLEGPRTVTRILTL